MSSEEVEMGDVYQEVDDLMTKLRVGMHKIKPSSRKYAFELQDIPKEADYLKLMYPYESECKEYFLPLVANSAANRACAAPRSEWGDVFTRIWY